MNNFQETYSDINKSTGPLLDDNDFQIYSNPSVTSTHNLIYNNPSNSIQPNINKQIVNQVNKTDVKNNNKNNKNPGSSRMMKLYLNLIVFIIGLSLCIYMLKN